MSFVVLTFSFYQILKSFLDRFVALLLLALLFFPLLLVGMLIYFNMGPPVFFCHLRPGLFGKPFVLLKFRTMSQRFDVHGFALPDSERLTPLGIFLRKSSIDELPALLNVVLGDMSFVGPRPLLMQYLPLYSPQQARRHEVKPGLSGWAQINGRNAITWEEKFRHDVWYVDHQTIGLDLRILIITIWKVIRREGISAAGEATMAPFTGTVDNL